MLRRRRFPPCLLAGKHWTFSLFCLPAPHRSRYSVRFASSGHIMLKSTDGDQQMVSNRDLSSFIRHIQSFLPPPPPPRPLAPLLKRSLRSLPDREEEVFAKPLMSKVKNMPSKTRKPVTGSWARGRKRKPYYMAPSVRVISKVPILV